MSENPPPEQPADLSSLSVGFDRLLGVNYEEVTPDRCVATLDISDKHHQPYGIVHGGVYCSVIESVASVSGAVWGQHTGRAAGCVGVNNSTDFLRPVGHGQVRFTSHPIHRGRRQQLWQVDVTDADGAVIAQGRVRLQNVEPESMTR